MSLSRDWGTVNATPIDHSKFKTVPGYVRQKMEDIEERLKDMFYGFITGETDQARIKCLNLKVQGTAPGTISDGIVIYAEDLDSKAILKLADEEGNIIEFFRKGKINLNAAQLQNDSWLAALNSTAGTGAGGTGTVGLIKLDTVNLAVLPDGVRVESTAAPSSGFQLANKQYVDDQINTCQLAADMPSDTSEGTSYSAGTIYENTTGQKLLLVVHITASNSSSYYTYNVSAAIGSSSPPGTTVAEDCTRVSSADISTPAKGTMVFVVPPGWFWKVTNSNVTGYSAGTISRIEAWEIA